MAANILDSQLPTIDPYHSLVALDTSLRKSAAVFGYPSWIYKATSIKTGHMCCLRRLEGKKTALPYLRLYAKRFQAIA